MLMNRRIFILNEPNAPRLSPRLAQEIGLNESIILLQIEFWISISNHFVDGRYWTYQSLNDIKDCFPFWSKATINRAIKNMINKGYIFEGNFNRKKYDKTRWFSLNYVKLFKLQSIKIEGHETRSAQNETRSNQNETRSAQNETRSTQNETTIPEITTEITTETTTESKKPLSPSGDDSVKPHQRAKALSVVIEELLPVPNGVAMKLAHMLNGTAKNGTYKDNAVDYQQHPVTPEEFREVVKYYVSQKKPEWEMLRVPDTVSVWVHKYRKREQEKQKKKQSVDADRKRIDERRKKMVIS